MCVNYENCDIRKKKVHIGTVCYYSSIKSNYFMGHFSDSNESRVNDNKMSVSKDVLPSEVLTSVQQIHTSVTWLFITFIFLYIMSSHHHHGQFGWSSATPDTTRGRCINKCDVTRITVDSSRRQDVVDVTVINCFRHKLHQFK